MQATAKTAEVSLKPFLNKETAQAVKEGLYEQCLTANRKLFGPDKEVVIDGLYASVQENEDLNVLIPYQMEPDFISKSKKYTFVYVIISETYELQWKWVYNGSTDAHSRDEAVNIFNNLKDNVTEPNIKFFAIKRP